MPELRSMTLALTQRLDVEVEPLDSLFGIDPDRLPSDDFRERVAGLRLAWAVAADWNAPINFLRERRRRAVKAALTRAAIVGGVATGLGIAWRLGQSTLFEPSKPASALRASPAKPAPKTAPAARTPPAPPPSVARSPATPPPSPVARAQPRPAPAVVTPPAVARAQPSPAPAVATPPRQTPPTTATPPSAPPPPVVARAAPPPATATSVPPSIPKPQPAPPPAQPPRQVVLTPVPEPVRPSPPRETQTAPSASVVSRRPPARAEEPPLPFDGTLGTILYGTDRKLAIVDGRIVQVGDSVKGARVVEITPNSVLFRDTTGRLRRLGLDQAVR
jgi:hypothetical protein